MILLGERARDISTAVRWVRLDTSLGEPVSDFTSLGMKVIATFPGPYNDDGVSGIDVTTWVNNALQLYSQQRGGSTAKCPAIEVLNEPYGPWFWGPDAARGGPGPGQAAAGPGQRPCDAGVVPSSAENLAIVWASVDRLCSGLTDSQWHLPTGCPGWSVKDHLSHLVDYEARAIGRPAPEHEPGPLPHVRNELGRANEVGVDARRAMPGPAVLAEFREVTGIRLAQLGELTGKDLAGQAMTPVGPGTVADLLTMRVMDSWSHEQDIRRAVGQPGHRGGPAADEAMDYFTRMLPYLVGKRVGPPEGSRVVFRIGDRGPVAIEVTGGRARVAAGPGDPSVSLVIPVATFAALVGGRSDVPGDVGITGDSDLGRRVLDSMRVLP